MMTAAISRESVAPAPKTAIPRPTAPVDTSEFETPRICHPCSPRIAEEAGNAIEREATPDRVGARTGELRKQRADKAEDHELAVICKTADEQ